MKVYVLEPKNNIELCKYLRDNFKLMTTKELKDFVSCDYNVEKYMPKF